MKTFSINTLGCKVNQYESQQIRALLEGFGLRKAEESEKIDLIIINTCCVTHTASTKSRQQIRKFQKHHPEAFIVVCGCLPAMKNGLLSLGLTTTEQQTHKIRQVTNRDKLVETLTQIISTAHSKKQHEVGVRGTSYLNPQSISTIKPEYQSEIKPKKGTGGNPELPILTCFKGHTRAFLKIQDGCDGFCTYCIIPKTRPKVHSKTVDTVLNEAKALVRAGHKEIVITGICLGAYGWQSTRCRDNLSRKNDNLAELLDKIAQIPNLERIRVSSLEPSHITEQLLDTFCKHINIMPHLHLSLQSGSDDILRKMCRKYNIDEVGKKIKQIKSRLYKPAMTTDIIVGFPGETDEDFDKTVKLVKETGFAKIHVFRFSPRKGTPAARMKAVVDSKTINKRSEILRQLDKQSGYKFRNQFIGQAAKILIENNNDRLSGRSERYFMVYIDQPETLNHKSKIKKNELIKVNLLKNNEDGMTGQPIS